MEKRCNDCGWTGNENQLIPRTILKEDVEFVSCPDCESDNIYDFYTRQ